MLFKNFRPSQQRRTVPTPILIAAFYWLLLVAASLPAASLALPSPHNKNLKIMTVSDKISKIQDIIGTDAGDRGMKALIVPGDLLAASNILGKLPAPSTVLVLSGFPVSSVFVLQLLM